MAEVYVPYSGPRVTRVQAKDLGLVKFFTGEPCREGHLSQRYATTGSCARCFYEKRLLRRPLRPRIPLATSLELMRAHAMPEPNSGCWFWMGIIATNGYGRIFTNPSGHTRAAHRVTYELVHGRVPAGLDLDHLCRVRCCINPDHLEPVTRRVNNQRGIGGAVTKARFAALAVCVNGHPRTEEIRYRRPDGRGYLCRACGRDATARYRQRLAERQTAELAF